MAELFIQRGDTAGRLAATQSALHNAPAFPAAWDAHEQALESAGDPRGLRDLYAAGIAKFQGTEDLKVRYQTRLADFERSQGDAHLAGKLEQQMVSQNRRGRSDLSAAAGAEALARLTEAGDFRGALREFNSLARKLARQGGGNFFYSIVRPLVEDLRAAGREDEARDVIREARKRMAFEPDSILAREFDELQSGGTSSAQ